MALRQQLQDAHRGDSAVKTYVPDYYPKFHCIAGKCRHSCCIGWEIDIDDDTYEYYRQIPDKFGLMDGISTDGGTPHFVLTHGDRCPFLNNANLCEVIINLGEGALCQICDDHPRYRNFYSDRTEIGLGLCCEAAGKLILSRTEKMALVELENDIEDEFISDEDEVFFNFRGRIFDILQNRTLPINERISEMLMLCGAKFPKKTYSEWADIFARLERLDRAWDTLLDSLRQLDCATLPDEYDTAFEQLLVYFIYRHLADGLDDGRIAERVLFAVLGLHIIRALCVVQLQADGSLSIDDMTEIARQYSSEIEYCEDNINTLLDILGEAE